MMSLSHRIVFTWMVCPKFIQHTSVITRSLTVKIYSPLQSGMVDIADFVFYDRIYFAQGDVLNSSIFQVLFSITRD
jgi:hypothetical protein